MSDSATVIIGALIGAATSIIVALIDKLSFAEPPQGNKILRLDKSNPPPPNPIIVWFRKNIIGVFIFSTLLGGSAGYLLGALTVTGSDKPPTPTVAPTTTSVPPTLTITVIPTSTSTSIPTSTPTPACLLYQRDTDLDTITNLIRAEAEAVNTKNIQIIEDIFDPNAIIQQRDKTPPPTWYDPIERYRELFNTDFMDAQHFDILPAGSGITQTVAWFTSGSKGKYKNDGAWPTYSNPSTVSTPSAQYGSDHWTFGRNDAGCWVIIRFEFNAGHVQFPP